MFFLGEQDGLPERELKKQLAKLFDSAAWVRAAYLARVSYEEMGPVHVALCASGQPGQNRIFGERVGAIFSSIFGSHEHLDVIWLMPEQEATLASVCRPFFSGGNEDHARSM